MKKLLAVLTAACLAGCASGDAGKMGSAAATPLSDLNLVNAPIPPLLLQAQKQPYLLPPDLRCDLLAAEVRGLDEVLGPDLDTPPSAANPGLIERGSNALGDATVGALRGAAEGVIPFRGWVRKLTGAERYSKDVAAAIAAGTVRHAYLKGLSAARGCAVPMPAAPAASAAAAKA